MNRKPFIISLVFALSMGFFESAVVVYLREIAYPGGFNFPLQPLNRIVALTEIIRELFSMLMLISVAFLISRKRIERLAWFIFNFAVWDISYYLFLKILLNWPESFLTTDILFLIPVIWTGPVLAPLLLSLLMLVLAAIILKHNTRQKSVKFILHEIGLLIVGSVVVIISFTMDYLHYFFGQNGTMHQLFSFKTQQLFSLNYIPEKFYWGWFVTGFLVIVSGILLFYRRIKKLA